jgi:hypothetical protein
MSEALARALSTALVALRPRLECTAIERLALDCQPWNGFLEAAILTSVEGSSDPALRDPSEMAAWRHYAFTSRDLAWREQTAELTARMKAECQAARDRAGVTRRWLELCAEALASSEVRNALSGFTRAEGFACSVTDPDTDEEYVRR